MAPKDRYMPQRIDRLNSEIFIKDNLEPTGESQRDSKDIFVSTFDFRHIQKHNLEPTGQ